MKSHISSYLVVGIPTVLLGAIGFWLITAVGAVVEQLSR